MSTFDDEGTQSAAPLTPEIAVNIYNDVVMMSLVHERIIIELYAFMWSISHAMHTRGAYKQHDATIDWPQYICVHDEFTSMHICLH